MPTDLLERMRANPAGDWRIRDVEALCREYGLSFRFGKGMSHAHARIPRRARFYHPGASADQASLHSQAGALCCGGR
jgi:hypothetical protein